MLQQRSLGGRSNRAQLNGIEHQEELAIREWQMLGNWIRRKFALWSLRTQSGEIERFILSLKGQADDELGMLVALAQAIRVNLEDNGVVPRPAFPDPPLPLEEQLWLPMKFGRCAREFQRSQSLADAAGAMVWLHSARAIVTPELRLSGRQMWGQLSRGFPYAAENAEAIEVMTNKPIPARAHKELYFVPEELTPFD